MPRKVDMTWNSKSQRWFKKYKGKQHSVKPSVLSNSYPDLYRGDTEAGSYRAANAWWADKLLEIDKHPQAEQIIEGISLRESIAVWCDVDGEQEDYKKIIIKELSVLRKALRDKSPLSIRKGKTGEGAYSYLYASNVPVHPLRAEKEYYLTVPKIDVLGAIQDGEKQQRFSAGNVNQNKLTDLLETYILAEPRTKMRKDAIRRQVTEFLNFLNSNDPNAIKPLVLTNYKIELNNNGQSWATTRTKAVTVKAFVEWLYEQEVLDSLPRNIKKFKIEKGEHHPQHWTDKEIKNLFKYVEGENRLFCLLALNCGFYSVDIAHLKPTDIDWVNGRIKSKRHKTNKGGDLFFELWAETFELLKKYGNKNAPEYVFTTNRNTCLWADTTKDQIGSRYRTFKNGLDNVSLGHFKDLRKTGRNKLEDSVEYRSYALYYLQDSVKGVDQAYYRVPTQKQFSNLCYWLGEQFGF